MSTLTLLPRFALRTGPQSIPLRRLLHASYVRLEPEQPKLTSAQLDHHSLFPFGHPAEPRKRRHNYTDVHQLPENFGRNQMIDIDPALDAELHEIIASFKAPVRYAFAYGSAVFKQAGYADEDKPMYDFILAVSHPTHWHSINLQQNPHHYSFLMRHLGSDAIAYMQEKGPGAGVWFNVNVEINGKTIKYGVISIDDLTSDLIDWQTLYVAGRTQKPVRILVNDARVRLANQSNLANALRTALLLLPEEFTEVQLFETIAGLSYRGDFRMKVGENPAKVANIVAKQLGDFQVLYGGLIKAFWKSLYVFGEQDENGVSVRLLRQDVCTHQRAYRAFRLPKELRRRLIAHYAEPLDLAGLVKTSQKAIELGNELDGTPAPAIKDPKTPLFQQILEMPTLDQYNLWSKIVAEPSFNKILEKSIAGIVGRPTFYQSLKGILSAGFINSILYAIPKLKKKWARK